MTDFAILLAFLTLFAVKYEMLGNWRLVVHLLHFALMSLYDDDRYTWRETYFVLFDDLRRRPLLDELRRELQLYGKTLKILAGQANGEGRLRQLTVASYEDHSALEIIFRQGAKVAAETDSLLRILEKGCTPKERERLRLVKQWSTKLDVLHFEQTAGTAEFKVVKLPVLKFQSPPSDVARREPFPTQRHADRFGARPKFQFDPNSYENCLAGGVGDEYAQKLDQHEIGAEDSSIFERINPSTLVIVLEILCRLTDGIAIDPASGIIIDS